MATSGDKRLRVRLSKRGLGEVKDAGFGGAALGSFLGGLAGQLLKDHGAERTIERSADAPHARRMRARTVAMELLREFSLGMASYDTTRFLDRVEKELLLKGHDLLHRDSLGFTWPAGSK